MPPRRRIEVRVREEGEREGERRVVLIDTEAVKAMYDPLRFKIVRLLDEGRTAKEIAEEVGRPLTSLYYHLNVLVDHGLVEVAEERVKGRTVERTFRRTPGDFAAAGDAADAVAKFPHGGGQLAFAIRHLHRSLQSIGSEAADSAGPSRALDVSFLATDEEAEEVVELVRGALDRAKAKRPAKTKERRPFRAIVVIAPESDDAATAVVIEKRERRRADG